MGSLESIIVWDKTGKKPKSKEERERAKQEENQKKPGMTLFEHLHEITVRKSDLDFTDDNVNKNYSQYAINRWMSMIDVYIPIVNELNRYVAMDNQTHYRFYKSVIPKRNQKQYFPYIKKVKDLTFEEQKYIAHYFEIGTREAKEYIKILSEEQIHEILETYRHGKGKGHLVEI